MAESDAERLPGPGEQIQVRSTCCDGAPHAVRVLASKPGEVVVTAPIFHTGQAVTPQPGEQVVLRWVVDTPLERLTVLNDVNPGPPSKWVLEPQGETLRVQRREYVRLYTNGSAVIAGGALNRLGTEVEVLDVSEGGLRCLVDGAPVAEGDDLDVQLDLEGHMVKCTASVVRVRQLDASRYELGLKFSRVPPRDADRIRRHVFTGQRSRAAR